MAFLIFLHNKNKKKLKKGVKPKRSFWMRVRRGLHQARKHAAAATAAAAAAKRTYGEERRLMFQSVHGSDSTAEEGETASTSSPDATAPVRHVLTSSSRHMNLTNPITDDDMMSVYSYLNRADVAYDQLQGSGHYNNDSDDDDSVYTNDDNDDGPEQSRSLISTITMDPALEALRRSARNQYDPPDRTVLSVCHYKRSSNARTTPATHPSLPSSATASRPVVLQQQQQDSGRSICDQSLYIDHHEISYIIHEDESADDDDESLDYNSSNDSDEDRDDDEYDNYGMTVISDHYGFSVLSIPEGEDEDGDCHGADDSDEEDTYGGYKDTRDDDDEDELSEIAPHRPNWIGLFRKDIDNKSKNDDHYLVSF